MAESEGRVCPVHGVFDSGGWWAHGDECSAMCVDCGDLHTGDVGCAFVNVTPSDVPNT